MKAPSSSNTTAGFTIREADHADVQELRHRTSTELGITYDWAQHLGTGASPQDDLALVAVDDASGIVGQVGVRPYRTPSDPRNLVHLGGGYDPLKVPWWKVHVLAVDQAHQGTGVGRALLAEVIARLPRAHIGIYGNVDEHRTESIAWYRRQGFYLSAASGLTYRESPRVRDGVGLMPVPGQMYFRGYRSILEAHLNGTENPSWEERTARAEFDSAVAWRQKENKAAPDLGYRLYTRRIAAQPGSPSCEHATMGPRTLHVFGWDPEHRRVCDTCAPDRLDDIKTWDAEDRCDECDQTKPDVRLSWASDEDHLLIVTAGLCSACRSGSTN